MVTPPRPARVAYFGTPRFAVPTLQRLLASTHDVVAVVTQPDRPRGRGQRVSPSPVKEIAVAHHVPVFQPTAMRDHMWLESLQALQPDIGVVAAYGRILPQVLLDVPPLGMINVHASLLPRWRGAAPIHRAVLAGDAVTGVTIMRVVLALDAGPMLASTQVPIGAADTSETLEMTLSRVGADLLVDTLDKLVAGNVTEVEQDASLVTYAARLERSESVIDWARPAAVVDRQIRGLQPWPLATGRLADRAVALLHSAISDRTLSSAIPGTIIHADADGLHIACAPGAVVVTHVKPEGRRAMSVRDFLNGTDIRPGALFT